MISPELLRFSPFFGLLNPQQYKAIAQISQEESFDPGEVILREGQPAESFYILMDGCVELYFALDHLPEKEILVGEINPGEPFGVSSLIYPYLLTSTVRTSRSSRAIKIDSDRLRTLFERDQQLGLIFMTHVAQAVNERLNITRIQLAAERIG